jgi:hypothetical protein
MNPPGKQNNYRYAFDRALKSACARGDHNLLAQGARNVGPERYELPVLDAVFLIDLEAGTVGLSEGGGEAVEAPIRIAWQILALHYLDTPPVPQRPSSWVSFAELPDAKGYDPVYRGRVLGRLGATVGRDRASFVEACRRIGGEPIDLGDEGFRFQVFPRIAVAIVWYAGDEELPSGVSFPYPADILSYLSVEDVVVLSESLVGRLQGASF